MDSSSFSHSFHVVLIWIPRALNIVNVFSSFYWSELIDDLGVMPFSFPFIYLFYIQIVRNEWLFP